MSASTLLVLATFVTPLATGVRTAATLGTGTGGQAWLLSAMSVGLAAALLVAGEAADQLGRRRIFTGGLVLLAVGAAVSAVSPAAPACSSSAGCWRGSAEPVCLACSLGLLSAAFPPGPARAQRDRRLGSQRRCRHRTRWRAHGAARHRHRMADDVPA